jgi:hypothetical protein
MFWAIIFFSILAIVLFKLGALADMVTVLSVSFKEQLDYGIEMHTINNL